MTSQTGRTISTVAIWAATAYMCVHGDVTAWIVLLAFLSSAVVWEVTLTG